MRKIFLSLLITFCGTFITFAQKSQLAIFVYNSNNTTPTNALRSQLTNSFLKGGVNQYYVVDRTDEILDFLKTEYRYQGAGMVKDEQIVSIGEHLAANYICVVAVTQYSDGQYFFEGNIIDIEKRQIVKNSFFPNTSKIQIFNLNVQNQLAVGIELAKQLGMSQFEENERCVEFDTSRLIEFRN